EDPKNRTRQVNRRLSKFEFIKQEFEEMGHQTYFGPDDADYGIISFGSTQGEVEEAVETINDNGHKVKALNVSDIVPFASKEVSDFLNSVDEAMVVEMNATAQFRHHIQRELGGYGDKLVSLLKYDGNPFRPKEIVEGFEERLEGGTETLGNTRIEVSETKIREGLARGD
ncbi:MAG: 2-oxoacid:acceptor oxidoreductase subunit alpha, partial [Halobacteria archaeon]|nr:2-oxoacid:acceptor oxidoreductase subunit alpha [Halobacteria archaeon]